MAEQRQPASLFCKLFQIRIGIVGGNPGSSVGGIPYIRGIYQGGGYQANFGRIYHNDHGGNGAYDGGPGH